MINALSHSQNLTAAYQNGFKITKLTRNIASDAQVEKIEKLIKSLSVRPINMMGRQGADINL